MSEDFSGPRTPTGVWIGKDDVDWDIGDDRTLLARFRGDVLVGWMSGVEAPKLDWTHALRLPDFVS